MPPDIHVDLILGGHSHIAMDEAEVVNGIPIAQSSYGTSHIGRFDLTLDPEQGGIKSWSWERVPLTEATCSFDYGVDDLADRVVFHKKTGRQNTLICEFEQAYEHRSRLFESDLGNIIADAFAEIFPADFVIIQSGSLRLPECGPLVTEKDLKALYPFDDRFLIVELTGREIKDAFAYLFTLKPDGSVMNGAFQYSNGFRLVAEAADCWEKGIRIESLTYRGEEFQDDRIYRVGMTKNCVESCLKYFSLVIPPERQRVVSLSTYNELASYFLSQGTKRSAPPKGRFLLKNYQKKQPPA